MKKHLDFFLSTLLTLLMGLGSTLGQNPSSAPQKKRVVVLTFDNATLQLDQKAAEDIGRQVAAFTAARFIQEEKFTVIERARLEQLLSEMKTGMDADIYDPKTAAQIGKLINANAVVMGTITEFNTKKSCRGALGFYRCTAEAKVGLTVRLVDVSTGAYISAVDTSGRDKVESTKVAEFGSDTPELDNDLKVRLYTAATRKAVDDAVKRLVTVIDQKIRTGDVASGSPPAVSPIPSQNPDKVTSPQGGGSPTEKKAPQSPGTQPNNDPAQPQPSSNRPKILEVSGNIIKINIGKSQGATVGSTFVVVEEDVTRDPETKEVLDVKVREVGRIKITEVRDRISIGTITSGNGIKPLHLVRPQ